MLSFLLADVNFAADLSDLRHRKKYNVVLIHSHKVSEALKICATKNIVYEELVKELPKRQAEAVSINDLENFSWWMIIKMISLDILF